mgnify:CR=1 FL=1
MKYDFDKVWDRVDTDSIKWDRQFKFGVPTGLIPFWIADTDFGTLPEAVTAIQKRLEHPLFGYTSTGKRTNETVRAWYQRRHHVDLPVEAFSPSEGVVTSIWFSIRGFTEPGDQVLVFTPVYDPFFVAIRTQERKEVDCPLIYQDGRYSINWEDFEKKLAGGVKAMIFCNPHNPVGRVWSEEELRRVGEICLRHGVLVVSDEIHSDFTREGHPHTVFAKLGAEFEQNCLICTAPSKTFNLAGLQISNIFVPNPELRKKLLKEIAAAGYSQVGLMGLVACQAAYEEGAEWLAQLKAYLEENRKFVKAYLEEHLPEIRLIEPEGTYLLWLDFKALHLNEKELEHLIVDKAHLWLDSGAMFGPDGEGFERINIACPRATVEKALKQLEAAIRG